MRIAAHVRWSSKPSAGERHFERPLFFAPDRTPRPESAYGVRFLFTGREYLAPVGLYDYRHRVYSPSRGRFAQPDPLAHFLSFYATSSPVYFTDPLGLWGFTGFIGGGIAGAVSGMLAGVTAATISGGGFRAAVSGAAMGLLAGAAAGAIVGAINPFASGHVGTIAAASLSSALGDVLGQKAAGRDASALNWSSTAGAALAGAAGGTVGLLAAHGTGIAAKGVAAAVTESVTGGVLTPYWQAIANNLGCGRDCTGCKENCAKSKVCGHRFPGIE
ncbi:MAG: hypothetical protein NNA23_12955 [Nitrospira sp.]|nr:hypothetical protein [Nitrospira sp.]